jgi:hypothetical protein
MDKIRKLFVPQHLFLIDGIGAFVSALFLWCLIVPFESFFGFPADVAKTLSVIPFIYAIYSLACYFFEKWQRIPFIQVIMAANILYCILSLVLVVVWFDQITLFGLWYFLSEKVIILALVIWEWRVVKQLSKI